MNEFENKIKGWKKAELTQAEKSLMLKSILATPVKSPYTRYLKVLVYVKRPMAMALIVFVLFGSTAVFASQNALPGEKLYALKTKVVEPFIGKFNTLPEEKLSWEEERVSRRIAEAEALAEDNKLDEAKTAELEKKIEKSSQAFVEAVEKTAERGATSTQGREEKVESLKKKFRENLETNKIGDDKGSHGPEVKRLKEKALKTVESKTKKAQ